MPSSSPRDILRSMRTRPVILATRIAAATGIAAVLCSTTPARATVGSWGGDTSDVWSNSGAWSGGTIPNGAGDTANFNFNIAGTRTVTIDGLNGSRTVGILSIGDSNNSNAYVIAANNSGKLIFDNGASSATLTAVAGSAGDTISAPIVLNSALTIKNSASNTLTLSSGGISSGTAGTKTITIDAASATASTVTISGNITVGSGDIAIVKNSTNNLVLSGANNYTGGVTLNAGTLTLNSAGALGGGASSLTITGGTLAGTGAISPAIAESWIGDFAFGGTGNLNLGTGAVTLSASRTVTIGGTTNTFTLGGGIGESTPGSALTTANSTGATTSILTLSGTNTYTGGTNINGGVVRFNSSAAIPATGTITVQAGGALAVSVGSAYSTLGGWMGDAHLSTSSTGALALTAASSEAFNPGASSFSTLSLGAIVGGSFAYTGTYTPSASGYFAGGGGGTILFSNTNAFTGANVLTVGNGGGGTVIVSGANDISGQVTIKNGTLQIGNGGTTGAMNSVSGIVDNGVLTFNRSDNISFAVPISGTGSLTKLGAGNLALTGSVTYSGSTVLGAGTLTVSNDLVSSSLVFGASAGATSAAALDLSNVNGTFGSLLVQTNTATANTVTVGAAKTLTINGALSVGYNLGTVSNGLTATNKLTITGGALVVGNTSAIVNVGVAQTTQLITPTASTLDLSGLASVTLGSATTAISALQVGFGQTAGGTLLLSNTANLVTATTIVVGNSNTANGGPGVLTLGTGTNVLHADTFNVGFSKVPGLISFAINSGPGTVVIANKAGTAGAALNIGSQLSTGTAGIITGTLDLRGHQATVNAGAVTVGNNNNSGSTGSASGIIDFDTGTFTATSLALGLKSNTGTGSNTGNFVNLDGGTFTVSGATTMSAHTGTSAGAGNVTSTLALTGGSFTTGTLSVANKNGSGAGAAIGTVNVSGGSLTVSGATFTLASQATGGTATGTLNITGGTVTSNASILDGGGTTTTTITLNGGTLDLKNHNIGGATTNAIDVLNFQSGTLQNVAQINNGAAGVTKTAGSGNDTLVLAGTNTYTGATTVNEGTLLVTGSISGSAVAVNAGTLGGTGTINLGTSQSVTVAATLAPGAASAVGELTVAGGNGVTLSDNSTFSIQTGVSNASNKLTITGTTGNLSLAMATDTLSLTTPAAGTFTIASWTGTRTGFFDLVNVNGFNETYTISTAGSVTTYTFDSGDGSIAYDDSSKTITATLAIPEPASTVSLLGGLGLLTGLRRFRGRRRSY